MSPDQYGALQHASLQGVAEYFMEGVNQVPDVIRILRLQIATRPRVERVQPVVDDPGPPHVLLAVPHRKALDGLVVEGIDPGVAEPLVRRIVVGVRRPERTEYREPRVRPVVVQRRLRVFPRPLDDTFLRRLHESFQLFVAAGVHLTQMGRNPAVQRTRRLQRHERPPLRSMQEKAGIHGLGLIG